MVNINREIMLEGMRAPISLPSMLSQQLIERARMAGRIRCSRSAQDGIRGQISQI